MDLFECELAGVNPRDSKRLLSLLLRSEKEEVRCVLISATVLSSRENNLQSYFDPALRY
jgi:hypothetical protein